MNKALWYLSLFLTVAGVICLAAGLAIYAWIHEHKWLKGHATARVVDLELKPQDGKGPAGFMNAYYPVIEFYANGFLYKKTLTSGRYPSPYNIGDAIEIEFDPNNPDRFRIRVPQRLEQVAVWLSRAGIVMTAIGIFIFIRFAVRG